MGSGFGGYTCARLLERWLRPDEAEIVLRHDEVPELHLVEDRVPMLLGQTTWLGKPGRDPGIVFQQPAEKVSPLRAAA